MSGSPVKTEGVDISPVAVDNAAAYLEETGYPQSAAMLRALRLQLTASEKQRDEGLAHEGAKDLFIAELEQKASTFESALRGVMGIRFEDGYEVNVAALQHDLTASESVLRRIATGADRCLGIGSDAECRISLEVVMDMARAILAKGETK